MKKIILFAAAMVIASAAISSCSGSKESKTADETTATEQEADMTAPTDTVSVAEGVVDLKDDDKFRPGVKPAVATVLDFNATWCIPCKRLTPALHQAADSFAGQYEFYSVDVDSMKATKEAYNITSVPTVVIISPDGSSKTVTGLDDFLKDATSDETATIYTNLAAMLKEAAGK